MINRDMSKMIVDGPRAIRVTSDGRGLECTENYNGSNSSNWGHCYSIGSYGNCIDEIFQLGSDQIVVISDAGYEIKLRWQGSSIGSVLGVGRR